MAEKKKFCPCWRYHKLKGARLIKSQADLDQLGHDWLTSPASFKPRPVDSNPAHAAIDAKREKAAAGGQAK